MIEPMESSQLIRFSVEQFKLLVEIATEIPPDQQRLIFKAAVMKDPRTLESYGITADSQIVLVRSKRTDGPGSPPPEAPSSVSGQPSGPSVSQQSQPQQQQQPQPQQAAFNPFAAMFGSGAAAPSGSNNNNNSNPFGSLFGSMPLGAMPDVSQMQQQMMQNPQMISQMLDNPLVQSMMSNPDFLRSAIEMNPQMRQMMDSNPQLAQVLNNPELMRQSMELLRNPDAMSNVCGGRF